MAKPSSSNIYLEIGKQRTIASVLDWPGWCRAGRDEAAALQALVAAGPRYARALSLADLSVAVPHEPSAFVVVERLAGNASTDYGVPALAPGGDAGPLSAAELRRLRAILEACWQALDAAVADARGKALRKGPRGGGRALDGIVEHVDGAERGYLSSLGGKASPEASQAEVRQAILSTLVASAQGEIAERGPRGGKRWSPRYFVRRDAWHLLDHCWEIEDRAQ